MKNTILGMLKPSTLENEQESKQEVKVNNPTFSNNKTATKENKTEMYTAVNYDFLKSDIFTNDNDRVKICMPTDFDDTKLIGDAIKAGKIVILILDDVSKGNDQRILDMVTGVCYAYNIAIEKYREKQYLIDPNNKMVPRNYR